MTRDDIHEAAESEKNEKNASKGVKPGSGAQRSEGGSGLNGSAAADGGADAVPENTTGVTSPRTPNESDPTQEGH